MTTEEAKLKQYFYILRPLANLSYIRQYNKMPYMEYDKTLEAVELGSTILTEISRLKDIKVTARENYKIPQNSILMNYFNSEISLYETYLKTMKFGRNKDYHQADAAFKKIIEMAWKNA